MLTIEKFELHKLTLPLGRVVGDNNCSYDLLNVLAVVLYSNQGHAAWGFSESAWQGKFKFDAWYVHEIPSIAQLEVDFEKTWWPILKEQNPFDLEEQRIEFSSGNHQLDSAVRLALWDLKALEKDVPLYRLLNSSSVKNEALAYGSILDFPLNDKEVLDLMNKFIYDGFKIIKVKVGAEDAERDIRRLKLIKSYAGDTVKLTADANEAWSWETTLERLELYHKNGIELEYIEDPLKRDDFKGFAELTKRCSIPVIGHDYINKYEDLLKLVEYGGLRGIRTGKDIDYSMKCIALAESVNIPVYLGNSIFELNAHLALAFNQVDRVEFSYLATNDIIDKPIRFNAGFVQAPTLPGHGLYPTPEKLTEFSDDNILID